MRTGASSGLGVGSLRFGFVHLKYVCSCLALGLYCIFYSGFLGKGRTIAKTAAGINKCQS